MIYSEPKLVNLFLERHIEKTEDARFSNEAIRIHEDIYVAVKGTVDKIMELFGERGVLTGKGKSKLTTDSNESEQDLVISSTIFQKNTGTFDCTLSLAA